MSKPQDLKIRIFTIFICFKIFRCEYCKISRSAFFHFHNVQHFQIWRLQVFFLDFNICIFWFCKCLKICKLREVKISKFDFFSFSICFKTLRREGCKISKLQDFKNPRSTFFIFSKISRFLGVKVARL